MKNVIPLKIINWQISKWFCCFLADTDLCRSVKIKHFILPTDNWSYNPCNWCCPRTIDLVVTPLYYTIMTWWLPHSLRCVRKATSGVEESSLAAAVCSHCLCLQMLTVTMCGRFCNLTIWCSASVNIICNLCWDMCGIFAYLNFLTPRTRQVGSGWFMCRAALGK